MSFRTRSSGTPNTFAYLSGFALCLALSGLIGNLIHLQTLMTTTATTTTTQDDARLWMPTTSITSNSDWETRYSRMNSRKMTSLEEESVLSKPTRDESSEEEVLRTVLRRAVESLEVCREMSHVDGGRLEAATASGTAMSSYRPRLSPFGWINELTNHLSSLPPTTTDSYHKKQATACRLAPTTSCSSSQMTMLVVASPLTVDGTHSWRTLFLNLLHWLTDDDSTISEIHVLLLLENANSTTVTDIEKKHANTTGLLLQSLQSDTKYGHRLLSWHRDDTHKVTLVFPQNNEKEEDSSLWERVAQWSDTVKIANDAVLLVNGSVPYEGNSEGLQVGLELWKRHSSTLVASHVWHVHGGVQQETTNNNRSSTSFRSVCQGDRLSLGDSANATTTSTLPDWSGLLVHRSYLSLCWLHHPVTKSLRLYHWPSEESSSLLAMVLWLLQLSTTTATSNPLLYPSKVLRNGKGVVMKTRGRLKSGTLAANTSDIRRSRTMVENVPDKPPHVRRNVGNQRRLQHVEHTGSLDDLVLSDLAGYFGSVPSRVIDWCLKEGADQFLGSDEPSCEIPWMQHPMDNSIC